MAAGSTIIITTSTLKNGNTYRGLVTLKRLLLTAHAAVKIVLDNLNGNS